MRRASTLRLVLLALTWGSSFLWIALALPMVAPSWLTIIRLVLGSTLLLAFCRLRGHPLPPRRLHIAGLALGFLGTVLIFEPWRQTGPGSVAGVTACLGAAALYGLSYVYMARCVTPLPYNTIALAAGQLDTAAVLSFAVLPLDGGDVHPPTPAAVIAVLILGIAGTGLAYVLSYAILTAEGPTATSLVAYLIPVVAAVLGVLVLGDRLPPLAGLGAALVLVGVALVRRAPRAKPSS